MPSSGVSVGSTVRADRRVPIGRHARRSRLDLPFACYLFAGVYWVSFCLTANFAVRGPLPEPRLDTAATLVLALGCAACLALVSGRARLVAHRRAIVGIAVVAIACHAFAQSLGEEQPILRGAYPTWGVVVFWIASLVFVASLVSALGASLVSPREPALILLAVWTAAAVVALCVGWVPFTRPVGLAVGALPLAVAAGWFAFGRAAGGRAPRDATSAAGSR